MAEIASPPRDDAELEELCRLLLGAERHRLLAALDRLEQRGSFVDWQSQTLADAMRLALARDPAFAAAMGAMIATGVHTTVQRDSAAFGKALAPAMGPAIRNSVLMMLNGLIKSIESVVEQRLSWRSMQWRWQAWRTGRSFAEVAFLHTLIFRVEHVFIVHRRDGVQLLHAQKPGVLAREPDLIAAMLTAIQDFVRDAFAAPGDDTLTSFAVGELNVVVETGVHAVLAAVVRGQERPEIRLQLRESLDRIETTIGASLAKFAGDTSEFEAVRPYVESCLLESERQGKTPAPKKSSSALRWLLATAALAFLTWLTIGWITEFANGRRVAKFVAALRAEPGFVVTEVVPEHGRWTIRGLADPLARDAGQMARTHAVENTVDLAFAAHVSLQPSLVEQRLRRALAAPESVSFQLQGQNLEFRGRADHRWRTRADAVLAVTAGVDRVDWAAFVDTDMVAWQAAGQRLETLRASLADLQQEGHASRRELDATLRTLVGHGRILTQPTCFSCLLVQPPTADAVAAAAAMHKLLTELERQFDVTFDVRGPTTDATIARPELRFDVQLGP